jgi:hypothetical protein
MLFTASPTSSGTRTKPASLRGLLARRRLQPGRRASAGVGRRKGRRRQEYPHLAPRQPATASPQAATDRAWRRRRDSAPDDPLAAPADPSQLGPFEDATDHDLHLELGEARSEAAARAAAERNPGHPLRRVGAEEALRPEGARLRIKIRVQVDSVDRRADLDAGLNRVAADLERPLAYESPNSGRDRSQAKRLLLFEVARHLKLAAVGDGLCASGETGSRSASDNRPSAWPAHVAQRFAGRTRSICVGGKLAGAAGRSPEQSGRPQRRALDRSAAIVSRWPNRGLVASAPLRSGTQMSGESDSRSSSNGAACSAAA